MDELISEIVGALEPAGAFNRANLLDPASLVRIAITLVECDDITAYRAWLRFAAQRYDVDKDDLASNVLIILASMDGYVEPDICKTSRYHTRALVAA